jgi:hypothetical protein
MAQILCADNAPSKRGIDRKIPDEELLSSANTESRLKSDSADQTRAQNRSHPANMKTLLRTLTLAASVIILITVTLVIVAPDLVGGSQAWVS